MSGKSIRSRAPAASSALVRRVMQANHPRDTAPEVALRRALHAAGLRFRKDWCPEPYLRCKSDIVFPRQRLCVFVDGCFWHRCPLHFQLPKSNSDWWDEKIQATVDRDVRQSRALQSRGWMVLRVWEHETVASAMRARVERIAAAVKELSCPRVRVSGVRPLHSQNHRSLPSDLPFTSSSKSRASTTSRK